MFENFILKECTLLQSYNRREDYFCIFLSKYEWAYTKGGAYFCLILPVYGGDYKRERLILGT